MTQLRNSVLLDQASRCVAHEHDPSQGLVQPIYTSTSYHYLDEAAQPYPRYFNTPNQESVSRKIAAIENAEAAIVFNSGMAAISTCVLSLVRPGDHLLMLRGLYGGTHSFLVSELTKWGVDFDFAANIEEFATKCRPNTVLAYIESPTNPCLDILDLRAMVQFARDAGVLTVIDNTFASPINQNPIDFGIDLVVHSGTKYLGGHSDLTSGAVVGSRNLLDRVAEQARKFGGALNPQDCHLLERSLKTLDVRVTRQNENAMAVATFLQSHHAVTRILYPGLSSHPEHALAKTQMRGFGGMMAFELHPNQPIREFLTRLKLITPAMSLGGVESIISIPALTSHKYVSEDDRRQSGVTPNLLRLSIGIESPRDLIADLDQAIEKSSQDAS
ncbi:MAG: aminotransferase class I/II-fold pyridoxal phosphate-dependent enzyme [Planctomycetaceae bacterium]|nr:aminotransferase class I/II-fold pyridoxal phosphate-dependent enzyme [Planctomycetaceae bacterium]